MGLGSYILRDASNDEVCFVIRDLEKFRFSTCTSMENYHFAIFKKNCIFPGFYNLGDSHTAQVLGKGKAMMKLTPRKTLSLNEVLYWEK